jgi:hypothetical protein
MGECQHTVPYSLLLGDLQVVPAAMGFGSEGTVLKSGATIPPGAELEYDLELVRVSIPPS